MSDNFIQIVNFTLAHCWAENLIFEVLIVLIGFKTLYFMWENRLLGLCDLQGVHVVVSWWELNGFVVNLRKVSDLYPPVVVYIILNFSMHLNWVCSWHRQRDHIICLHGLRQDLWCWISKDRCILLVNGTVLSGVDRKSLAVNLLIKVLFEIIKWLLVHFCVSKLWNDWSIEVDIWSSFLNWEWVVFNINYKVLCLFLLILTLMVKILIISSL